MTIVVPVAITPAGLPLPDPADRATFSARKLEQLRWANNEYSTGTLALGQAAYSNALHAQGETEIAVAAALAAAAAEAAATAISGAVAWVSDTTYAAGVSVWSLDNWQTYRRTTAGGGIIDPASDPANWEPLGGDRPWVPRSANCASYNKDKILADTSGGSFAIALPVTPAIGDSVQWKDVARSFALHPLTFDPGASYKIMGQTAGLGMTISTNGLGGTLVYSGATYGWVL